MNKDKHTEVYNMLKRILDASGTRYLRTGPTTGGVRKKKIKRSSLYPMVGNGKVKRKRIMKSGMYELEGDGRKRKRKVRKKGGMCDGCACGKYGGKLYGGAEDEDDERLIIRYKEKEGDPDCLEEDVGDSCLPKTYMKQKNKNKFMSFLKLYSEKYGSNYDDRKELVSDAAKQYNKNKK